MACIYSYYKKEETYYPRLYCKINGKQCMYTKKCLKQEKFIPTDNQDECYLSIMESKKNIPNGTHYVRFTHKGYLFIEIDDKRTIKVKNTLGEVGDYVYIKQVGNDYEISLSPFPTEVKEESPKKVEQNQDTESVKPKRPKTTNNKKKNS